MDFNARGARLFGEITAANVNRRLAIVLDDTIYSAPVIKERFRAARRSISGSFTPDEAKRPVDRAAQRRAAGAGDVAEERPSGRPSGRTRSRRAFAPSSSAACS
jgi:preprotein translocase subunit SecD